MAEDQRTNVLRSLISRPLREGDVPEVTREMASVVIGVSQDTIVIMHILRGGNGDGEGLIEQMATIKTSMAEMRVQIGDLQKIALNGGSFGKMTNWFVDKILPTLIIAIIVGITATAVALYLHVYYNIPLPVK